MPGVLDSRYNLNWFDSWAKTHPWVIEEKPIVSAPDQTFRPEESSEITSLDITPKLSTNDYERTPRVPLIPTTNQSKLRVPRVQIEQPLPTTPITSCKVTVTSIYHIPKPELSPSKISSSDNFTYRAHRVQIHPTIDFPPPPPLSDIENETTKQHDYEDMNSPLSSKRPSHNLLSNIVPSPSTDQSSQQSTKHIASSFGFDTSIEPRHINDTTIYSNTHEQIELESISSNDDDNDYESNHFDYLCKSTSTLGIPSPGAQTFYS